MITDNANSDRRGGDPIINLFKEYRPGYRHSSAVPLKTPEAPAPCWTEMRARAERVLQEYDKDPGLPIDAALAAWCSPDGLSAWCMVLPPLAGGEDITLESLKSSLAEKDIKLGLDEWAIAQLAADKDYLSLTHIAKGLPAQDGEDGSVELMIQLNDAPGPVEDEYGKVDFKELGWLTNVDAGDKLCRIIPPTPGRDGFTVKGHRLHAKAGHPAPYVCGENTEYTEDGEYLIASVEGRLVRKGPRYAVTQTVTIPGNVDYSTGNISSNCTVIVMGDVFPEFKVTAQKDIIVYGTVDGGTLEAGGDISVYGGVLASNQGVIRAGGNLKCKFMEYGNAHVGGNAYFENLIHSRVSCAGDIFVLSGRGIVIGGQLTAMGNISVTTAGNRASCATELTVGPTEDFIEHKRAVAIELEAQVNRCNKITAGIDKLRETGDKGEERRKQLEATLPIERIKVQRLQSEFQELERREQDIPRHRVTVNRAFPRVRVRIAGSAMQLSEEMGASAFYHKDGEMRFTYHWPNSK